MATHDVVTLSEVYITVANVCDVGVSLKSTVFSQGNVYSDHTPSTRRLNASESIFSSFFVEEERIQSWSQFSDLTACNQGAATTRRETMITSGKLRITLQIAFEYNDVLSLTSVGRPSTWDTNCSSVLFARMGPSFITTGALSSRVSRRHCLISYHRFNHLFVYLASEVSFRSGLVRFWHIHVWHSPSYRQKLLLSVWDPPQPRSPPRPALSLLSNARITLLAFPTVLTRSGTFIRGDVTRMIPRWWVHVTWASASLVTAVPPIRSFSSVLLSIYDFSPRLATILALWVKQLPVRA